ncbi:MAG: ATP-binding protein, partial [Bacteroidales bacterium]|nr:ATP-binding protein [Bacteroidales bacterium]
MFVNRIKEEERIRTSLKKSKPALLAIYGRRRCGKSTLLKRIISEKDVYYVADMREKSLQISSFAKNLDIAVPGFSSVHYPDWRALFSNLNNSLKERITVCIDEFPYLVKNDPGLPSIMQNIIDNKVNKRYNLVLCGSSQQMMEDMVLNSSSPLYGRCDEIINIKPMTVKWFCEYFETDPVAAVEGYSVFGGVPRYWELLKGKGSVPKAVKYHILDKDGILHKEPEMLFHDEMRTSV